MHRGVLLHKDGSKLGGVMKFENLQPQGGVGLYKTGVIGDRRGLCTGVDVIS